MSVQEVLNRIPGWAVGVVVVLFITSLAYGHLVRQNLFEPIAWWIQIVELVLLGFIIYLFYRFVIAVETIADKQ